MFNESPFSGACAASTWEVLAMILGSALLGLLLGYLIWGWLRGRILQLEQRSKELERIAHLKDSQIIDLNTRIKALDGERERLSSDLRLKSSQYTEAMAQVTALNERLGKMEQVEAPIDSEGADPARSEANVGNQVGGEVGKQVEATGTTEASLAIAASVFGKKVQANDLTVVEGIGPKIAGLLSDAGIPTWAALGDARIGTLREVLENAGPRYRMHDPETWARQSRMAASGEWKKLKVYQDSLNRGK